MFTGIYRMLIGKFHISCHVHINYGETMFTTIYRMVLGKSRINYVNKYMISPQLMWHSSINTLWGNERKYYRPKAHVVIQIIKVCNGWRLIRGTQPRALGRSKKLCGVCGREASWNIRPFERRGGGLGEQLPPLPLLYGRPWHVCQPQNESEPRRCQPRPHV